MIEISIKAYHVSELLPETSRSVLVWRSGAAFGFLKGHWEISKCRLTKSGPRWECDEDGPIPLPMSMCRKVTHWGELPRDAFYPGHVPPRPIPAPAARPTIAQPTPDSRPIGPPNEIIKGWP